MSVSTAPSVHFPQEPLRGWSPPCLSPYDWRFSRIWAIDVTLTPGGALWGTYFSVSDSRKRPWLLITCFHTATICCNQKSSNLKCLHFKAVKIWKLTWSSGLFLPPSTTNKAIAPSYRLKWPSPLEVFSIASQEPSSDTGLAHLVLDPNFAC